MRGLTPGRERAGNRQRLGCEPDPLSRKLTRRPRDRGGRGDPEQRCRAPDDTPM